ncbi:hypothetical protein [Streptomyces rochei]|uniref:hypothetical protein n=1 Tax=Streptomyces rochei TaxID=1928 RepID=UPI00379C80AC
MTVSIIGVLALMLMRGVVTLGGKAGGTSIRNERPVIAEQVYAALVALGAEPVADPELRSEEIPVPHRLKDGRLKVAAL